MALLSKTSYEICEEKSFRCRLWSWKTFVISSKKGFDILGIDASPLAVKVCRLRGKKKAQIMSLEDMNFKPNSFDSILLMGNNFSLFGGFKKAQRLLK